MPIWFCRDHCNACNGPADHLWCAKDRRDKEGNADECRFEQEFWVCPECEGRKVVKSQECPRCWGEGVIAKEQEHGGT